MPTDKLILRTFKAPPRKGNGEVIRITGEAMEVLEQYQRATGLPIKEIASRMITYAADYTEVVHEKY